MTTIYEFKGVVLLEDTAGEWDAGSIREHFKHFYEGLAEAPWRAIAGEPGRVVFEEVERARPLKGDPDLHRRAPEIARRRLAMATDLKTRAIRALALALLDQGEE